VEKEGEIKRTGRKLKKSPIPRAHLNTLPQAAEGGLTADKDDRHERGRGEKPKDENTQQTTFDDYKAIRQTPGAEEQTVDTHSGPAHRGAVGRYLPERHDYMGGHKLTLGSKEKPERKNCRSRL